MKKSFLIILFMFLSLSFVIFTSCKDPEPPHEHTYSDSWTKDATYHWHASTCGHEVTEGKAAHTFGEWEITKEPTEEAEGSKGRTCTVCGYKVTEAIAKNAKGFVFIKGDTIIGAENANNYEGVFIECRTVTLSDFYMGKYEVTQEEYASVMAGQKVSVNGTEILLNSNPSRCKADSTNYVLFKDEIQERRPVEAVTWYDALLYCNFLSERENFERCYDITVKSVNKYNNVTSATVKFNKTANGYRLPTEAEWEFAARGGNQNSYEWNYLFSGAPGDTSKDFDIPNNEGLDVVGWYLYNNIEGKTGTTEEGYLSEGTGTHQVGLKKPNSLMLYDMSGNVWEWCWDIYGEINSVSEENPLGAESGNYRMYRGGSWYDDASYASVCDRSSYYKPSFTADNLGFRVVRSAK